MSNPWDPASLCICGHVLDEHDPDTLSCTVGDCRCAGHEPKELEDE